MAKAGLLGAWGERLAGEYLRKKGLRLLETNFRCRFGEIDLICRDKKYLVFVEVKLRKDDRFAAPREFVDFRKQQRLKTTAEFYLSIHDLDVPCRFDVVEIYAPLGMETQSPIIHHLEDAFI